MGKPTGFLEYERSCGYVESPQERIGSFRDFHHMLTEEEQKLQGGRCMDCGVPFCQAGMMIGGMASGCPLHNLIPEINDLVWHGCFEQAYERLARTHCLAEFTSRVCPALCEAACTCNLNGEPVSTKENEKAVIEYAFAHDLMKPKPPLVRTGKTVAVIGSGPAGLAASILLNRRGHSVTVYERSDRAGGLLRYGIPNMKLEKSLVDRRIRLMEEEGIVFRYRINVGKDITGEKLLQEYDRIILACGASRARDIEVPGRDAEGIYFAVDFLKSVTEELLNSDFIHAPYALVREKKVVVIGGGDTGNDCVATALRLSCSDVVQLEMMPKPPTQRSGDNPWPEWPKVLKTDYGQEEAISLLGQDPRIYQTTVTEFIKNEKGRVCALETVSLCPVTDENTKRTVMKPMEGTKQTIPADLVLIAAGYLGCEAYVAESFGASQNARSNIRTLSDSFRTEADRVFAAGDMRRGQSLVVWAVDEGQRVAREVDESLMGYSNL